MKRTYLYIYSTLAIGLAACTPQAEDEVYIPEISLAAQVQGIGSIDVGNSRADGDGTGSGGEGTQKVEALLYRGINPADAPFTAAVWFAEEATSGYKYTYTHNPNINGENATSLPIHSEIYFDKNTPIFPPEYIPSGSNTPYKLRYPIDKISEGGNERYRKVSCVGFYPTQQWETTDGLTATHAIDGAIDLMYAPPITGSRSTPLQQQTYEHLQTWLKICVCATSKEAANNWGEIEYIKVTSRSGVSIDLTKSTVNDAVSYTTETKDICAVEDAELSINIQEVGSVFCSPEEEYTLQIKATNNNDVKTLKLKPKTTQGTVITGKNNIRGQLFVLILYFQPYSVVEGVCTLNAWENQDEDLYPNQ